MWQLHPALPFKFAYSGFARGNPSTPSQQTRQAPLGLIATNSNQ
jgi:hypothetical protein